MKKLVLGLLILSMCLIGKNAFAVVGIDSYTVLMLHSNGEDGSVNFADSSFSNHQVTAANNAQVDIAQSKFGGASGLFDGAGDYLSMQDSDNWTFGNEDFTIDFLVRLNAVTHTVFYNQNTDCYNQVYFNYSTGTDILRFYAINNVVAKANYTCSWAPQTNQWYHIAAARNNSNFYIFINGISQPLITEVSINSNLLDDVGNTALQIGAWAGGGSGLNGWIDEYRISKGVARWIADFTPPTSEYATFEPAVPEPATLSLLGLGLAGLAFRRKKIA